MTKPTTTTYALLGLLAVRSWTSYELTHQARRSLRYAWPRSEANLYAEQKRLVRLGWAEALTEEFGRRSRTRYAITAAGRRALRSWMASPPTGPRFEVEAVLRLLFVEHGSVRDVVASLEATAAEASDALDAGLAQARGYLEDGGPFPERLPQIAVTSVWFSDSLALLETFCRRTAELLRRWEEEGVDVSHREARQLLEQVLERHGTAADVS